MRRIKHRIEDHETRVALGRFGVDIYIEGYGVKTLQPGYGAPIFLGYNEGKFTLYVWADINQEDPTHTIDLSGALESNREDKAHGQ